MDAGNDNDELVNSNSSTDVGCSSALVHEEGRDPVFREREILDMAYATSRRDCT